MFQLQNSGGAGTWAGKCDIGEQTLSIFGTTILEDE